MASDKLLAEWFWIDRWVGSSAFGLNISARGLYREMLTQAWRRGASLPNDYDQIRRFVGVTKAEWRHAWPFVQRFWRVDGDVLVNDTQLEVYAEAQGRQRKAFDRAMAGVEAAKKMRERLYLSRHLGSTQVPTQVPTQVLTQVPTQVGTQVQASVSVSVSDHKKEQEEEKISRVNALDRRFDTFWAAYPKKVGKEAARKSWRKCHPDEALTGVILVAITIQEHWPQWLTEHGRFIPNPSTWLNQGRWQDEAQTTGPTLVSDITQQNIKNGELALQLIKERYGTHR